MPKKYSAWYKRKLRREEELRKFENQFFYWSIFWSLVQQLIFILELLLFLPLLIIIPCYVIYYFITHFLSPKQPSLGQVFEDLVHGVVYFFYLGQLTYHPLLILLEKLKSMIKSFKKEKNEKRKNLILNRHYLIRASQ